jgi:hypothetical protein
MSVKELMEAYEELPAADQLLFASLVAADQLTRQPDFAATLARRHRAMDEKKWSHEDARRLHHELEERGL